MRVMVSSSPVLSATVQEKESIHCSIMGSIPWEIVPHEILQCEFFLRLLFCMYNSNRAAFPWDAVLQASCPSGGPPWGQNPTREPGLAWALCSMSQLVLPRTLLQHGLPTVQWRFFMAISGDEEED